MVLLIILVCLSFKHDNHEGCAPFMNDENTNKMIMLITCQV